MIILRFSDYETDTVAEHTSVIASRGRVWWGWWKKAHEPWPEPALRRLNESIRENGCSDIGLVDRGVGKFYAAECVDLAFGDGSAVASPAVDQTPSYYGEKGFPAWFCLEGIRELPKTAWVDAFGMVPIGDPTFFAPRRPPGEGQVARQVQVIGEPCMSEGSGVLHISDLHFGSDHGFHQGGSVRRDTEPLIRGLRSALPAPPAVVIVSGDLTTRGDSQGLVSARLFLENLAEALGLPKNAIVIAPGNHDILVDDPNQTRTFENEQLFRDMVHLFYGVPIELERVHCIRGGDGILYLVGVVNSSRPRSRDTIDYGFVGRDRSEPVLRTLGDLQRAHSQESQWRCLVLHHHVLPAPLFESPEDDRPVSLTLDAGELVSLAQRFDVDAILHGHQHLPFIGQVGRLAECGFDQSEPRICPPLLVLGAGSTGARVERLPDELRNNSFGHYQPTRDSKLAISVFEFNQALKPLVRWQLTV